MSEAEKAADVEDVLSSIRRLVANRPRSIPKTPEQAADPVEQAAPPQLDQEPEPTNFIKTMNATIAEITQQTEVDLSKSETVEEDAPLDDAQTRAAHVDAFLTNTTDQSITPEVVDTDAPEKPAPFVLRAEMSADTEEPEPTTVKVKEPEQPEPVLKEENEAQVEYETSLQDIPEDETAFPDLEDTEIEDMAPNEQFIDEDMLREIVGELVRSELQGDLGDRITRNVRKLVRREIHQALAARNFD